MTVPGQKQIFTEVKNRIKKGETEFKNKKLKVRNETK